ncbi:hypothetical protein E3T46_05780 [Cryobacterium sp. Hh11]|uniref:hypothetical protein n=1 Tax=Cryobacterium sp. Hh11 TaxID=2555868 RepID=UPI00106D88D0|nr:hypothetical protein [Cryobacterium sp. Hh11]TFD52375.1 hypothetical protein E3T46_05780 [Cryobacterium sp. Hh11]
MANDDPVTRPTKKSEYTIRFASAGARKGWRDLVATIRNPMVDAWDFLTKTPIAKTPMNYPLRGELQFIQRAGKSHERWQHKPTVQGDARIWFYVDGQDVFLEQVHTHHPNATK